MLTETPPPVLITPLMLKVIFNIIITSFKGEPMQKQVLVILAILTVTLPFTVQAGNDIYFVTYNHHIEKGEVEFMLMTDITAPAERTDKVGTYMSNMLELEYGITNQWATELMVEDFVDFSTGEANFTGFRLENRYRVVKDENWFLNPVLYMEYEDLDPSTRFKMEVSGREDGVGEPGGEEPGRERIMETRLLLSRDFGPWNVAFNWINETDLQKGGYTEFGYAMGIRRTLGNHHHHEEEEETGENHEGHKGYHGLPPGKLAARSRWKPAALGLEFFGGLGNINAFGGSIKNQQHYVSPIIMFHPTKRVMLHIAPAIGITPVADDLLRFGVSLEI